MAGGGGAREEGDASYEVSWGGKRRNTKRLLGTKKCDTGEVRRGVAGVCAIGLVCAIDMRHRFCMRYLFGMRYWFGMRY